MISVADLVVEFIRTQEEADRLMEQSALFNDNAALQKASRLQRKANRLLAKYQIMKRGGN
jgi:hypothetical protein